MLRSIILVLGSIPVLCLAQSPVGQRNITFIDPSRGGRQIPCEVYYPATVGGVDAEVATGAFPVIAFGHGFAMGVSAYSNFTDAIVPEGYIMVLPTTEGSLLPAPSHNDFGLDLAFVIGGLQAEGVDVGSPFFGHVASTAAVMGHSMGGGASLLAAAAGGLVTTAIVFAPAETNPSAISASAQIVVPTLVFSGSQDCVTPPVSNQVPMYEALSIACRAYIQITGGGHCNFANSNFNCSFGEFTCGGGGSLGRPAQQAITEAYTLLWLGRFLKDDLGAGDELETMLLSSEGVVSNWFLADCPQPLTTGVSGSDADRHEMEGRVVPSPMNDHAELRSSKAGSGDLFRLVDATGRVVREELVRGSQHPIERGSLYPGTYVWTITRNGTTVDRGRMAIHY